jgi:hypothetical protein
VSRGGTFDTATSFQVAVREALIGTIVVGGTKGHTSVGKRIAVRLVRDFTTIRSTAGVSVDGAIIATSVGTAVRSGGRAIGINLATNAGTRGNIASRLVRGLSSVQSTALGVGSTSEASTIGLTIVLSSVLGTTGVIVSVSLTDVRVDATSIRANGVGSHGERSIVGNTVSVSSARYASTILHAIFVSITVTVVLATRVANISGTNFVAIDISGPRV